MLGKVRAPGISLDKGVPTKIFLERLFMCYWSLVLFGKEGEQGRGCQRRERQVRAGWPWQAGGTSLVGTDG